MYLVVFISLCICSCYLNFRYPQTHVKLHALINNSVESRESVELKTMELH